MAQGTVQMTPDAENRKRKESWYLVRCHWHRLGQPRLYRSGCSDLTDYTSASADRFTVANQLQAARGFKPVKIMQPI